MKNTVLLAFLPSVLLINFAFSADENCTSSKQKAVCNETIVKEKVDWACKLVEKEGKGAIDEISLMRYDCCGEPDYVWINDTAPKMVMHPIKTNLNGTDLKETSDHDGDRKHLFVDFVDAAKKSPDGAWVDYKWKKVGEAKGSPKKSWVKLCKVAKTSESWLVGSGTWK